MDKIERPCHDHDNVPPCSVLCFMVSTNSVSVSVSVLGLFICRTQINSVQQEEPKEGPGFDRNSLELAHTFADTFYRKIKHFFALIYL